KKIEDQKELMGLAGAIGFRAAGDIASSMQQRALNEYATAYSTNDPQGMAEAQAKMDSWSDGGLNKTLLHGLTGAAVAALGGGDVVGGALAAAGAEKAKLAMAGYLRDNGVASDSETYRALMELGSAAIGGALGGLAGANTALAGDQFNRQLHPDELAKINASAADFAALECGQSCTPQQIELARQRLTVQAMRQTDSRWNDVLGMGGQVAQDGPASNFLDNIKATHGTYTDFAADWHQYNNSSMFAGNLRGTTALDQVYGTVLGTAVSTTDQRYLLQALNRTNGSWANDYVSGVLNKDAWTIGTTFTGDVGFAADVTKKLLTGNVDEALSAVAAEILFAKAGEVGKIAAGRLLKISKDALETRKELDVPLPSAVKDPTIFVQSSGYFVEVPVLRPKPSDSSILVDSARDNKIDVSGSIKYPDLPGGYSVLDSSGSNVNEVGSLPNGSRRLLTKDGEVVVQAQDGSIYKELNFSSGEKGGWNKSLNKPESNAIYNVDGNKVYRTDSDGRVDYVEANLSLVSKDRNGYQQCKAGNCGLPDDEGGHLIASIFDGPGERLNLVPMNANLNKGAWKSMENEWANALKNGKSVKVKIEPIYSGSAIRPDSFR
ncbi:DNA/RNA non-specific endonuclease, partial [Xanthomonas arboricola]